MSRMSFLGIVAVAGVLALIGCTKKSGSESSEPGIGERAGVAVDEAVEKTKDVAGEAVEKTGEAIEKGGEAVEKAGEDMQK